MDKIEEMTGVSYNDYDVMCQDPIASDPTYYLYYQCPANEEDFSRCMGQYDQSVCAGVCTSKC